MYIYIYILNVVKFLFKYDGKFLILLKHKCIRLKPQVFILYYEYLQNKGLRLVSDTCVIQKLTYI